MSGSIKRKNSHFTVTLELGKDHEGKRLRKYITVSTEAEAKRVLSEFQYNQQRNLQIIDSKMTISNLLETWTNNYVIYNCEETTRYAYKNVIKHINEKLGNIEIQKILPSQIQEYYKYLMDIKKFSSSTIHKHHACLRKALDYGLKQQLVHRNVADAVTLPKKIQFKAKTYSKEQLRELLDKVKGTPLELPIT